MANQCIAQVQSLVLVLGPVGPDLGPDLRPVLDLTWDLDLDLSLTICSFSYSSWERLPMGSKSILFKLGLGIPSLVKRSAVSLDFQTKALGSLDMCLVLVTQRGMDNSFPMSAQCLLEYLLSSHTTWQDHPVVL